MTGAAATAVVDIVRYRAKKRNGYTDRELAEICGCSVSALTHKDNWPSMRLETFLLMMEKGGFEIKEREDSK